MSRKYWVIAAFLLVIILLSAAFGSSVHAQACTPPTASHPLEWWSVEIGGNHHTLPPTDGGSIGNLVAGQSYDVIVSAHSDAEFGCGTDQPDESAHVSLNGQGVYITHPDTQIVTIQADTNGAINIFATALGDPGSMFIHVEVKLPPPTPQLNISHIECADQSNGTVEAHFVAVHVNAGDNITDVHYIIEVPTGITLSRTAQFDGVTGHTAHFTDYLQGYGDGNYTVISGYVTVNGTVINLHNPQTITVNGCEPAPTATSTATATTTDIPTETPEPSSTWTPQPSVTPTITPTIVITPTPTITITVTSPPTPTPGHTSTPTSTATGTVTPPPTPTPFEVTGTPTSTSEPGCVNGTVIRGYASVDGQPLEGLQIFFYYDSAEANYWQAHTLVDGWTGQTDIGIGGQVDHLGWTMQQHWPEMELVSVSNSKDTWPAIGGYCDMIEFFVEFTSLHPTATATGVPFRNPPASPETGGSNGISDEGWLTLFAIFALLSGGYFWRQRQKS